MADVVDEATGLSDYAWEFRYPGASREANDLLVQDGLALAQSIYEAVLTRLPKDAHP